MLDIVNNVDHVRLGKGNTFIFSVENTRKGVAPRAITIVVKADTGEFMGIKTSGFDRMSSLEKRPILWEAGAVSTPEAIATPTVTTIKAQQGDKHMGRAEGQSLGEISDGKVNDSASEKQAEGAESSVGTDRWCGTESEMPATPGLAAQATVRGERQGLHQACSGRAARSATWRASAIGTGQ